LSDPDTLSIFVFLHLAPEGDHMSGRNMLAVTV